MYLYVCVYSLSKHAGIPTNLRIFLSLRPAVRTDFEEFSLPSLRWDNNLSTRIANDTADETARLVIDSLLFLIFNHFYMQTKYLFF